MTYLMDVINDNFDETICTAPDVFDGNMRSLATLGRGVIVTLANDNDMVTDIIDRNRFRSDSYDGYIVELTTEVDLADAQNLIKGLKKTFATLVPTADGNIIKWEGGEWIRLNNVRWEYKFVALLKKAGIQLF